MAGRSVRSRTTPQRESECPVPDRNPGSSSAMRRLALGMPTVLHLLSRFNFGGTERQLVERLRRHPRGFQPILACSEAAGGFLEPVRALGVEPVVIPVRGLAHPSGAAAVVRLAALIKSRKVDLVHANDFAMSVLGLAAARIAGARIVTNRVDGGHLRP